MNEVDDNGNEIHGEYDNSKVKIIFFGQGNKIIFKEKINKKIEKAIIKKSKVACKKLP